MYSVTSLTGTANQVLVNGTSGSATIGPITLTLPQSIGTGNSPTFLGLTLTGLTASQAVVTDGSKNLASLAYSATGGTSNLVSRDSNGNTFANNFTSATTSNAAGGGPINLNAGATRVQITTGSGTQTYKLANATQLNLGSTYEFNNNATGNVTINDNSNTLITTVLPGGYKRIIVTDISSPAGVWDFHSLIPANSNWGSSGATLPSSAFVSAGQFLLTGTGSGTISILPQAAAGTYNFNMPTTAGTSGQLLTSAGGGASVMTWSTISSIAVTSILGTANQITASAPVAGVVTLSIPTTVAIGTSNTAASSTQITLNSTSAISTQLVGTQVSLDASNNQAGLYVTTAFNPTGAAGKSSGIWVTSSFAPSGGGTSSTASGIRCEPTFTGSLLFNKIYGIYVPAYTTVAGSEAYGAYIGTPSAGSSGGRSTALYADNAAVGVSTTAPPSGGMLINGNVSIGTTSSANKLDVSGTVAIGSYAGSNAAPSNGLIVSGNVSIGTNSNANKLDVSGGVAIGSYAGSNAAQTNGIIVSGRSSFGTNSMDTGASFQVSYTNTTANAGFSYGIINNMTFNPTGGASGQVRGISSQATYIAPTATTIANAFGLYSYMITSSNVGSITNLAGLYVDTGSSSTGTVTNAYGGYFNTPAATAATSKMALYADSASIGYATTTPPSSGLIVSGKTGIGNNGPTYTLDITTVGTTPDGSRVLGSLNDIVHIISNTTAPSGGRSYALTVNASFSALILQRYNDAATAFAANLVYFASNAGIGIGTGTTTPPAGGIITLGSVGVGTSSITSGFLFDAQTSSVGTTSQFLCTGAAGSGNGCFLRVVADPGSAITSGARLGGYQISGAKDSSHTITNAVSMTAFAAENWNSGATGAYLQFETTASGGTSRTAKMYVQGSGNVGIGSSGDANKLDVNGNCAIGSGYMASLAPTDGIIVQGTMGLGTSTPSSSTKLQSASTNAYNIFLSGTQASVDGSSDQAAIMIQSILQPTNGGTLVAGVFNSPNLAAATGKTISFACGEYINPTVASNIGTITAYLGLYLGLGDNTKTGTVTSAYNLYASQPFAGSTGNYYAVSIQGGEVHHWGSTATDYTVKTSDYIVAVSNTSAGRTITLPSAVPDAGWEVIIKDESGGAATHNISVSGNGHNIDGATPATINTNYGVLRIYSNGTQYYTW